MPELILLSIQYLAALAFGVTVFRRKARWSPAAFLLVLTVAAFLFVGGPAAQHRFRLLVEPVLNLAAGAGLTLYFERRKQLEPRNTDAQSATAG